jgi:hypothetical protein
LVDFDWLAGFCIEDAPNDLALDRILYRSAVFVEVFDDPYTLIRGNRRPCVVCLVHRSADVLAPYRAGVDVLLRVHEVGDGDGGQRGACGDAALGLRLHLLPLAASGGDCLLRSPARLVPDRVDEALPVEVAAVLAHDGGNLRVLARRDVVEVVSVAAFDEARVGA